MPDFVTAVQESGERQHIPVIQVWVDPKHRSAHLDPALRAYLARRGEEEGAAALIRYSSNDGFVLFPPALTGGDWVEHHDGVSDREHTAEEKFAVLQSTMSDAVMKVS